jgi:DNA polymerase-3 subunit alpha
MGGMISAIARRTIKKPNRNGHSKYVNFDLEDETGVVRCIMWPDEYARGGEKVQPERVCFVKGRVERRGREPNLIVNDILTIEEADQQLTRQVAVKFQQGLHSEQEMVRVRDLLRKHPGKTEVVLIVDGVDPERDDARVRYVLAAANEFRVTCSHDLVAELREVLGQDYFELHGAAKKANGRTTPRPARGQLVGASD